MSSPNEKLSNVTQQLPCINCEDSVSTIFVRCWCCHSLYDLCEDCFDFFECPCQEESFSTEEGSSDMDCDDGVIN